jgi:hypothetical protein
MKKNLVVGGGVLGALIVGLVFYFSLGQKQTEEVIVTPPATEAPVIHITSGNIFVTKDGVERSVVDGEEIIPPYDLRSDGTGSAILSFTDGSELRLDANSKLTVQEGSYSPETKNLIVHTKLTIGRVWSNIIALTTPESSWEVETSNVVATVRGTAFGVATDGSGTTTVTGSEHTVELTLIDPDTGERNPNRKFPLNEDEFVVINNNMAQDDSTEDPEPQKKTEKETNDPWVDMNEKRDRGIFEDTESLLEGDGDSPIDGANPLTKPATDKPLETVRPVTPTTPPAPTAKAVSLAIKSPRTLEGIIEGTQVNLSAIVTYSNGTTKDVSKEAVWKVLGPIGGMQANTFTPLLGPSVSEFGKAPGSITATWKEPSTGAELFGSTAIFEVKANVTLLDQRG